MAFHTCKPAQLPLPYQAETDSALFCSPANYVRPNADQIYMFADAYHPTSHLQQVISDHIVSLTDSGLSSQEH